MMFDKILTTLAENGKSGLAYGKVIEASTHAMKDEPNHATGYLLLKVLAERFIENTGRLPVTGRQTNNAYEDFASHVNALSDEYASGDQKAINTALNKVSLANLNPFDPTFPVIE